MFKRLLFNHCDLDLSFTCEFEVERRESNREGLKDRAGERHVHVEVVLAHATKLQVNVVVVILVYQLKVLH